MNQDHLYMGYIPIEKPEAQVLIGPVSALPYTPERLALIMHRKRVAPEDRESARQLYQSIPNHTHVEFIDILLLFQFAATGRCITRDDFFRYQGEKNPDQSRDSFLQAQLYSEVDPEERYRNDEVLRFIEAGYSDAVFQYLCNPPALSAASFGTTPLIYQKHVGYYSVGMFSAGRVFSIRLPSDTNTVLLNCIHFIRQNIYNHIQVCDVAAVIGYSNTHTTRLFKQELGMGPAKFILQTRLEEAKSLLRHTDKSLSEISSALCFYDQSHFQRCFKGAFRITPMEYRQKRKGNNGYEYQKH